MTIRDLHLLGSPVLREASAPIKAVDDEILKLAANRNASAPGVQDRSRVVWR